MTKISLELPACPNIKPWEKKAVRVSFTSYLRSIIEKLKEGQYVNIEFSMIDQCQKPLLYSGNVVDWILEGVTGSLYTIEYDQDPINQVFIFRRVKTMDKPLRERHS